jgi:hypothetical protein
MHYLSSIYFVKQLLHVSGMFITNHHDEVTVYAQQLVPVAYRGVWGVKPSPLRNSEVLSKLSRISSSVENTSVTTW